MAKEVDIIIDEFLAQPYYNEEWEAIYIELRKKLGISLSKGIDKATAAAKEYYELKLKNEEAAIQVVATLAERKRIERLIVKEMLVAGKEGMPTSRLTSLATAIEQQDT